ncbi:hypothetical protein Nepgr_000560 [Nepenthes gracilis]|uniref:Uncharacterized protein n=1 Tax=Nepenthes gracilis TaxID=150966 RepID=A0AAD3P373_NEPGR|nr:hypothetical protein Nepgr_000560 [Nepenthes gracilis]
MKNTVICMKKIKKMAWLLTRNSNQESSAAVAPPPHRSSIYCDDLFRRQQRRKGTDTDSKTSENNIGDNSFIATYIAAQNYFSLRPNIYI